MWKDVVLTRGTLAKWQYSCMHWWQHLQFVWCV